MDIAALTDDQLAEQHDLAERGLSFCMGCDNNSMLGDERYFRALYHRTRVEIARRQNERAAA